MRRKIKKAWRHFKYWLVKKLISEEELNFIGFYSMPKIQIVQIKAEQCLTDTSNRFYDKEIKKDILLKQMHSSLRKHIEFEETWEDNNCNIQGTIYLVKREENE